VLAKGAPVHLQKGKRGKDGIRGREHGREQRQELWPGVKTAATTTTIISTARQAVTAHAPNLHSHAQE